MSSPQTINCQGFVNVEKTECLLETKLGGTPENTRDMPAKKINVQKDITIQKISIHAHHEKNEQVFIKPKKKRKNT